MHRWQAATLFMADLAQLADELSMNEGYEPDTQPITNCERLRAHLITLLSIIKS